MITHIHLEPDILECEVKWALGSVTTNKASGGDGIPAELLQTLKDDAVSARFGSTYTKIGTIQRRLAWPLRRDKSTHIWTPYL